MKITATELAAKLNGREYRKEITEEEEKLAKENNLLVVFGYSDDNLIFKGVKNDEHGAWGGGTFSVDDKGQYLRTFNLLEADATLKDLSRAEYNVIKELYNEYMRDVREIYAAFDINGYSWFIEASTLDDIGYFDIMEDGEKYCRGIVLQLTP